MINLDELKFICLVMELGEMDLNSLLQESILGDDDITVILYNLLKALNFIHSSNVIHRDIKPSNILIDSDSRVMICDFGLARTMPKLSKQEKQFRSIRKKAYQVVLQKDNNESRDSQYETFKKNISSVLQEEKEIRNKKERNLTPTICTRWYRSPEVILCDTNYNQSCDIWSLGCTLAEMLTSG